MSCSHKRLTFLAVTGGVKCDKNSRRMGREEKSEEVGRENLGCFSRNVKALTNTGFFKILIVEERLSP